MNKENTNRLTKEFPDLYSDVNKSPIAGLMCFGFECGDGWFELIYKLSKEISKCDPTVRAIQVKEKYGTLRFYVWGGEDEIYELIEQAKLKSAKTCEVCGMPGSLRGKSWLVTLCENCWRREEGRSITTWMAS